MSGFLDLLSPKEEEPKPETGPRPLRVTFDRGPATAGSQRRVASFGLTPLGKQKIKMLEETDIRYQILVAVEENGPSSVGEIADRVHISPAKTEHHITGRFGLVKAGCLKVIGSGGE